MHKTLIKFSNAMGRTRALRFWRRVNPIVRRLAAATHWQQHYAQFGMGETTEWMDHYIDMYHQWPVDGVFLFAERGIYNCAAIRPGAKLLDLCCGGGFNTKHFYANQGSRVVGADFDPDAIAYAKANNAANNIDFVLCDIREGIPSGPWDNICWDAAIEHFTADEIQAIMGSIKSQMTGSGILSGYTFVEPGGANAYHEIAFTSCEDLKRFFTGHFRNVRVWETFNAGRHNLYFYASDGPVPFDNDWKASAIGE